MEIKISLLEAVNLINEFLESKHGRSFTFDFMKTEGDYEKAKEVPVDIMWLEGNPYIKFKS